MTFSERLADAVYRAACDGGAARSVVETSFTETLAVAAAGRSEPVVQKLLALYDEHGDAEHRALIGAAAAHALDYDDLYEPAGAHLSAVVVPALAATDSPERAAGYVAGWITAHAVGRVLGRAHYAAGWHQTSTVGVLAATAAVARARSLSREQICQALSFAVVQAGGMQRNFGTMAKPMHAALAASGAIRAVRWVEAGFTADGDPFGPRGFFDLFGAGKPACEPAGVEIETIPHGISRKLYACCFASQRMIAAVLAARAHVADPSQAAQLCVESPEGALTTLPIRDPKTSEEAKFCLAYILACAWTDGAVNLDHFGEHALRRADLRSRMTSIDVSEIPNPYGPGIEGGVVTVTARDRSGAVLGSGSARHIPGFPQWPATAEQLETKYEDCMVYAGRPPAEVFDQTSNLLGWKCRAASAAIA